MMNAELIEGQAMTEEELFRALKNIPTHVQATRFAFNPNPMRPESSIQGNQSKAVIIAAKIACGRSTDGSCNHHEVAGILTGSGFKMSPHHVQIILSNLTTTKRKSPSTTFIRVPKA
jgi:hypothetical protein